MAVAAVQGPDQHAILSRSPDNKLCFPLINSKSQEIKTDEHEFWGNK